MARPTVPTWVKTPLCQSSTASLAIICTSFQRPRWMEKSQTEPSDAASIGAGVNLRAARLKLAPPPGRGRLPDMVSLYSPSYYCNGAAAIRPDQAGALPLPGERQSRWLVCWRGLQEKESRPQTRLIGLLTDRHDDSR